MNLPTPYTLAVRRFNPGATDAHGNPVKGWKAGVDWPVFAYYSGANAEPHLPNRDLSMVLWTVLAPANDLLPTAEDLVTLRGVDYAVEGEPQEYKNDPWQHHVGEAVVYLRKAEG